MYHVAFPEDGWFPKCLVYGIYLLDTAQTFIVTSDVYQVYAKHYGQLDELTAMHNEWLAVPIFSGIGSFAISRIDFFLTQSSHSELYCANLLRISDRILVGIKTVNGINCYSAYTFVENIHMEVAHAVRSLPCCKGPPRLPQA